MAPTAIRIMPFIIACYLSFFPIPAFSDSDGPGETGSLSQIREFLTREVNSLKVWMRENLGGSSGRDIPRVVIDLPPVIKKETKISNSEPQQAVEIERADTVLAPGSEEESPAEQDDVGLTQRQENSQSDVKTEILSQVQAVKTVQPDMLEKEEIVTPKIASNGSTSIEEGDIESETSLETTHRKEPNFPPGKIKPERPSQIVEVLTLENETPKPVLSSNVPKPMIGEEGKLEFKTDTFPPAPPVREAEPVVAAPPDAALMMGQSLALWIARDETEKSCVEKRQGFVLFCIRNIRWPEHIRALFETSITMYRGTQAVVRYDNGKLTHAHAVFLREGLGDVVSFFEVRFGPPLEVFNRIATPFESRPEHNPTFIWRKFVPVNGSKRVVTLEVRGVDDSRGGFPDMDHGLVRLYGTDSLPIFPQVSPREMMLLKYAVK